ncbi:MAG: winged helix-turn-helix domain-containing protein [Deltaproteobacteria bacterium]|nr:winged helix-turn-helix domain-containing protein [Deltaproteobacteria bacterium]
MRFVFGEYELEPESRTLQQRGERVPIEPKVFDLFVYLIEHRSRVVSTNELLDTLWPGVSITPAALTRAVQKARHAVGDDGKRQAVLRTEHGRGFQFVAQVSVVPAADSDPSSPVRSRAQLAAVAGFAALLLVALAVWLLNRSAEDAAPGHSLVVLPLANLSGDPGQDYFADGMTEALISNLAKIGALRVISRTSAMHYKDTRKSLPEIAQELNVDAIIEGSVLRSNDRIRITTQLIDVETDSHLWSQTYDRALSDIFSVQDEIAASVAEALQVALLGADSSPIRRSPETSIENYSDYLLAQHKLTSPSYANFTEAVLLLTSVITRDPEYTPAYTSLAGAYESMAAWGMLSSPEAATRMKPVVEQALSLNNQHAAAWYQLAFIREEDGDFEGANAAWERALELGPRDPSALRSQMVDWLWTHEPERGLAYAAELLRVDPLSTDSLFWIAEVYRRLGRFDDAETIVAHMRSIDPKITLHLSASMILAFSRGDLVTALGFQEELAKIEIDDPEVPSSIARNYLALGDVAAAEHWKNMAMRLDAEAPWARLMAALLHLYRGEEDRAAAIARDLTQPGSRNRQAIRGIALRIVLAADLAEGKYEEIIDRYLTHYPELADGIFPTRRLAVEYSWILEAFLVTLDLASVYLHAGENAKAESLLSLIESELPHWPTDIAWGHGFANVELHALRGEKEQALAALRENVAKGMRFMWRWQLLYNQNLNYIRDTPEFAAIVAEIEADMAQQLARVREMERRGELAAIPRNEVSLH